MADDGPPAERIVERSIEYSLRIVKLYRALAKEPVGKVLGEQLLRSATSVGANVHEAQAGQSKADFVAKMSIAHKEARESVYWLELIRRSELLPAAQLTSICDEARQLVRILGSIILTAKRSKSATNSSPPAQQPTRQPTHAR